MTIGLSLHIGVDSVDPAHYGGWSGPLNACEYDARDMRDIAQQQGFETSILETSSATRDAVLKALKDAATKLVEGDILFVSYSGHGGQVPDYNGPEDEIDDQDETWCLFDGQLLDDELYEAWSEFAAGVRILVLSDSCHSGTVVRAIEEDHAIPAPPEGNRYRVLPVDIAGRTYRQNRVFYDGLQRKGQTESDSTVKASVMLISGCQDNQLSLDGTFNGKFTGTLLRVWRGGQFRGDYRRLHSSILTRMPATQSPNLFFAGAPNADFPTQDAFSI